MSRRIPTTIAAAAVAALALTSCSAGEAAELENGDRSEIEIGVFSGWPEGIAVSELWRAVLEEEGYDVTLTTVDVAPGYAGVASADYDLVLDSWLPDTHADYVDEYGDELVDLGAWYVDARNTIVVNEDAPITSLDELADHADEFGNTIVGMEPGAGLTQITEESVIPSYGLEDMEFLTSSTAALLTELQTATDNGENIVATLARPHWAYEAFPIRDLLDPEGAFGSSEEIHTMSSQPFADESPRAAGWIGDFEMSEEQLMELCNLLFNENDGDDPQPLVDAWINDNREWVDTLTQ